MKPAEKIEKLIKRLHFKASAEMHDRTINDALDAQAKSNKRKPAKPEPSIGRTIMKSRITKLATAAMVVITVLVVISQLGGSSVAWADVLENIRNSKTLTFLIRTKEQEPPIMKAMVIDPYLLRFEFLSEQIPNAPILGGQIWIVDTGKAKALILNTVKKTGKVYPADKEMLCIYDTFRNFRDRVDFTVEEIGRRQIGDKQAIGFKLKKEHENHEIIVWADLETKLPILMEETYENSVGQIMQHFVTDIAFDAELDLSLFSLKPPEGYRLEKFDYDPAAKRAMSATNMDRILKACRKYVSEHGGRWPDSLQELAKYGLTKDILTNPRQPSREASYVYLKPPASPLDSRIVLYEAYDIWNVGINVGFANYHVQFIKEESEFKKQLKESSAGK